MNPATLSAAHITAYCQNPKRPAKEKPLLKTRKKKKRVVIIKTLAPARAIELIFFIYIFAQRAVFCSWKNKKSQQKRVIEAHTRQNSPR